ncbi:hypothetical protein [Bacillus suaedae]|uniref:DUF3139 domain-containing protein n=1 Tax=Halalkalibacter suaedae TaxID=2822140 RepID=A0A940WT97_9BACI|nr:hypothetical protein [Bacillus suaedae]MBP3951886.1 hypothetical protein [Bacillus suaedae]
MKNKKKLLKPLVYSLIFVGAFLLITFLSEYLEKQAIYSEAKKPSEDAVMEFIKAEEIDHAEMIVVDKDIQFKHYFEHRDFVGNHDYCIVTYIFEIDTKQYEVVTHISERKGGWEFIDTNSVKQLTNK